MLLYSITDQGLRYFSQVQHVRQKRDPFVPFQTHVNCWGRRFTPLYSSHKPASLAPLTNDQLGILLELLFAESSRYVSCCLFDFGSSFLYFVFYFFFFIFWRKDEDRASHDDECYGLIVGIINHLQITTKKGMVWALTKHGGMAEVI